MEPQTNTTIDSTSKASVKDFFLNLGAIVALYTIIISLINLLFTVINRAYPPVTTDYVYFGSQAISWPVAILIVFFPIFVLLMWLMEKSYVAEPEKKHIVIRRWLTYITLFIAGLTVAIDLVTILFYFIDGREITTAFFLKVLVVLVVALGVFLYYISDLRNKLDGLRRKIWLGVALVIILGSIIWGFSVLGSPNTQRLYKYDEQKISDLSSITNAISNYYSITGSLPNTLDEMSTQNYFVPRIDSQTSKPYEYEKTGKSTYNVCAEFNKSSTDLTDSMYAREAYYGGYSWIHPAGRYCFAQTINPNNYYKGGIPPPTPTPAI